MEDKKITAGHDGSDQSHSRHRHHKHRGGKSKFSKFIRENKRALIGVGIAMMLFMVGIALVVVYQNRDNPPGETGDNPGIQQPVIQTQVQLSDGVVALAVPHLTTDVPLADEWVKACVTDPELTPAQQILAAYRRDGLRLDRGLSASLFYEVAALPKDCFVASARLLVSEDAGFASSRQFVLEAQERTVQVYLLKADTTYYYKFDVTLSDRSVVSVQSSFHTAPLPRILTIGGLANVRDIGGWVKVDGTPIRQGLLYRGSEIDNASGRDYMITAQGREDMANVLGIRLDMDLREPEVAEKGFSAGEEWKIYNAPMYVQIFQEDRMDEIKEIFTDLANPDNYPVYLHCAHGRDRTGTVVFLLEAVLGVSEADIIREYELSALYFDKAKDMSTDDLCKTMEWLEDYGGATLQENARLYLLSAGITDEQIQSLKTIYLGG